MTAVFVQVHGATEAMTAAVVAVRGRALAVIMPGGGCRYFSRHDGRGFGSARGTRVHPADVGNVRRVLGGFHGE